MTRIFRSSEMSLAEFERRYLPERIALREALAQRPVVRRAAPVAKAKSKIELSPWPFASWAELARAKEKDQLRRRLALAKQRAGLLPTE